MPLIIPFGIIVYKKYMDRKEIKKFKNKICKLPDSTQKERRWVDGEKKEGTFHDCTTVTLMSIPFFIISGVNQLFLKSWSPTLICVTAAFLSASVYYIFRHILVNIDFYIYSSYIAGYENHIPLEKFKIFFMGFTGFVWVVASAFFYTIIM